MYILAVLILSYARHKKWTYDLKTFSYSKRASSLTHIINSFTFKKSVYTSIVTIKKDEVVMGQNYLDMGGRKESEVALSVFGGTLKDDLPQDSPPSAAAAPRSLGPPRGRSSLAPAAPVQAQQRRVDPHGRVLGVFPAQDQKRVPKADYKVLSCGQAKGGCRAGTKRRSPFPRASPRSSSPSHARCAQANLTPQEREG